MVLDELLNKKFKEKLFFSVLYFTVSDLNRMNEILKLQTFDSNIYIYLCFLYIEIIILTPLLNTELCSVKNV